MGRSGPGQDRKAKARQVVAGSATLSSFLIVSDGLEEPAWLLVPASAAASTTAAGEHAAAT